jgi:hypothetical protein
LSTPTEETWPGVSDLPDFKISFPAWRGSSLKDTVKVLDDNGIDLLEVIKIVLTSYCFIFVLYLFHFQIENACLYANKTYQCKVNITSSLF